MKLWILECFTIIQLICPIANDIEHFICCVLPIITTMVFGTHALGHLNRTSCAQVHELPQSHCVRARPGRPYTLFSWLHIYILRPSCLCEIWARGCVCRGSIMTTLYIYIYIYIYIYMYIYITILLTLI